MREMQFIIFCWHLQLYIHTCICVHFCSKVMICYLLCVCCHSVLELGKSLTAKSSLSRSWYVLVVCVVLCSFVYLTFIILLCHMEHYSLAIHFCGTYSSASDAWVVHAAACSAVCCPFSAVSCASLFRSTHTVCQTDRNGCTEAGAQKLHYYIMDV